MPDQSELFDLTKKHLIGRLVTSTVSGARIEDISMPGESQFKHMLVLSAADFGNHTGIRIMDEELPFFARDEVFYKGQPVLAVFGYDSEDVELFCSQVKVSYRITPESEEPAPEQYGPPFIWSYGNPEEHFTAETKTFKSVFEVSPFSNSMLGDQRLFVVEKDGRFNIRLATQWPTHVRRSVAEALECDMSDVILHPQPYYSPYDQLVVFPAVLACIAALAARISGELVQLSSPMVSWQPHMTIEHETAYNEEGTLLADRANCSIDLGAFPFFTSEVYHSILAGLIPAYPLKAAEVCILTNRSPAPPSNFFGDLGYSMALAGTENHFSQLAISLGMQPGIWKMARLGSIGPAGIPLCESVKQGGDYDKLEDSAKEVLTQSWYSRKYAANTQKHLLPLRMNPAINYSRGIGFACGQSILGFSQQFNASANHYITVTMNENETLVVNIGMQTDRYMTAIWKDTIRKYIDIPDEDIVFVDINDPGILDLGPNALARKTAIVSSLLEKACSEMARKLRFSRLPVTIRAEHEAELSDPFFFSSGLGSVAIDLHVDTVMLSPIIDNIWVNFHVGHVFDRGRLLSKARHTITTVLSDICPRSSAKCNIDIQVFEDGHFPASSLTTGLRGLTTAALTGALSQALGYSIRRIPVTSDDILGIAILQHQNNTEGGER